MHLYLLRHGHDVPDLGLGPDPRRLSSSGEQQALLAARWLASARVNLIRTSSLRRAQETGTIVGRALNLGHTVDDRLDEVCSGSNEQATLPPRLARSLGEGSVWSAAVSRVGELLDEFVGLDDGQGGAHLWVGHSGTADAVFELVTGTHGEVELDTAHGCLTHWQHRPGARDGVWLLHGHNLRPDGVVDEV